MSAAKFALATADAVVAPESGARTAVQVNIGAQIAGYVVDLTPLTAEQRAERERLVRRGCRWLM